MDKACTRGLLRRLVAREQPRLGSVNTGWVYQLTPGPQASWPLFVLPHRGSCWGKRVVGGKRRAQCASPGKEVCQSMTNSVPVVHREHCWWEAAARWPAPPDKLHHGRGHVHWTGGWHDQVWSCSPCPDKGTGAKSGSVGTHFHQGLQRYEQLLTLADCICLCYRDACDELFLTVLRSTSVNGFSSTLSSCASHPGQPWEGGADGVACRMHGLGRSCEGAARNYCLCAHLYLLKSF